MKNRLTKLSSTALILSTIMFGLSSPTALAQTDESQKIETKATTIYCDSSCESPEVIEQESVDKTKTFTMDLFHDSAYLFDE